MSLKFIKLFASSLRQNITRQNNYFIPGIQIRSITAMEVAPLIEKKDDIVQDKNRTRYKRRRQWDDKKENGESQVKKPCDKPFERIKRKKMAMLLGYCGVNYYGMQRNPGVPTIEEDLLKALYDAKYITEEDFNNQQNAQFQRSSRTDKGVSAARQVVSLKLPLEVSLDEINSRLPDCIKVFGIKRVTNKFNSKSKCNARTYSYTLPTYVFESSMTEGERKTYRITTEKMIRVNEVLGVYKGTKSYHNFTEKKHYQDPSALRYMMSFELQRVFLESEMEFAELLVKGQSFMLHQIRKMVGFMIAIVRGHTDLATLEKAFGKDKVMIPTAPGLGLVLDKVHYERYDAKFKDSHDSLTWDVEEEAVERFKREKIFPNIVKGELESNSMGLWLEKIKKHSYEPCDDLTDNKNDDKNEMSSDEVDDDDDEQSKLDDTEIQTKLDDTETQNKLDETETQNKLDETETQNKLDETEIQTKLDETETQNKLDETETQNKLDETETQNKLDYKESQKKLDETEIQTKLDETETQNKLDYKESQKKLDETEIQTKLDETETQNKLDYKESQKKLDETEIQNKLDDLENDKKKVVD